MSVIMECLYTLTVHQIPHSIWWTCQDNMAKRRSLTRNSNHIRHL